MDRIQFKGIEDIGKEDKYQLNKIVNGYYDKIARQIKNDFTLLIKIKTYQKPGKKDKAAIHIPKQSSR